MVTTPFTIRLGVRDADTVRRALQGMGTEGDAALKKLDRAARRAEQGTTRARGAVSGLGREVGLLATRLIGPTAALAALAAGVRGVVSAGVELEKSQFTIAALLKTTGAASGRTAEQIETLARSIGRATLQSTEGAREAAAALLTFKNVSGDAFDRTLRVAADLSAVLGQDLRAATLQLGKALEDPERNLSQLNRSGISFTQTQIDLIKRMKETGDQAGALNEILKVIEGQVSGAGAAQAGGLAGAWDSFGEALQRRFEILSQTGGALQGFADGIRAAARALEDVNERSTPEGAVAAAQARLAELERRRASTPGGIGGLLTGSRRSRSEIDFAIAQERDALRGLLADLEDVEEGRALEEAAARAGAKAHEAAGAAAAAEAKAKELLKVETDLATKAAEAELKAREAASKRAQAIIEADAKRERAVAGAIAKLEQAAQLEGLSAEQKEIQRALIEAQNALLDEQGLKLRDLTDEEKRRIETAVKQTREIERQRDAAKKAAEAQQRALEHALERGTDFAADAFYDAFEGKIDDIGELFETTLKRAVAQGLAEAVVRPIIAPILAGIAGGAAPAAAGGLSGLAGSGGAAVSAGGLIGNLGLGDLAASAGGFLAGGLQVVKDVIFEASTIFDATGAFGVDLLGGGLTGGALGGLAAKLLGLGSGNAAVDFGLGGAGTLLGTFLGGPIGGAVGGFLGTAVGGLFGGKPSVGPNGGVTLNVDPSTGRLVVHNFGGDNGFDGSALLPLGQAGVGAVNTLLDALGGRFTGSIGNIGFNQFDREGGLGAVLGGAGAAVRGRSPEEALNDFAIGAFRLAEQAGRLEGVDAEVLSAIRNSAATTIEAFASDLDFAAALSGATLGDVETTQAEQAIAAINGQFADLAERATALGLSLETLDAARDRALADLTAGFDASISAQILGIVDPTEQAFAALAEAQEKRLEEAKALGADLVEVERLAGLERQRLAEQVFGDLDALLTDLTVGGLSAAAPSAKLAAARTAFESASASALAGETVPELAATVRQFVEASRAVNATGGAFGADQAAAIALLEQVKALQGFAHGGVTLGPAIFGEAGAEAAIPLDSGLRIPVAEVRLDTGRTEALLEALGRQQGEAAALLVDALGALRRDVAGLREENAALRREIRNRRVA